MDFQAIDPSVTDDTGLTILFNFEKALQNASKLMDLLPLRLCPPSGSLSADHTPLSPEDLSKVYDELGDSVYKYYYSVYWYMKSGGDDMDELFGKPDTREWTNLMLAPEIISGTETAVRDALAFESWLEDNGVIIDHKALRERVSYLQQCVPALRNVLENSFPSLNNSISCETRSSSPARSDNSQTDHLSRIRVQPIMQSNQIPNILARLDRTAKGITSYLVNLRETTNPNTYQARNPGQRLDFASMFHQSMPMTRLILAETRKHLEFLRRCHEMVVLPDDERMVSLFSKTVSSMEDQAEREKAELEEYIQDVENWGSSSG